MELDLTCLCLGYLTFRYFDEISESDSRTFISKGYYSFLDYAAVYWADHLEEYVQKFEVIESITVVSAILRKFLQKYWPSSKLLSAHKDIRAKFSYLKTCEFYEQLVQALSTWKRWIMTYDAACDPETLDLMKRILVVRKMLEQTALTGTDEIKYNLTALYGENLFKCSKIRCKFFVNGFQTKLLRDQHDTKHKRAFLCTHSRCPYETLGFNTMRELDRHFVNYHEAHLNDFLRFPVTQDAKCIDIKRAARGDLISKKLRYS